MPGPQSGYNPEEHPAAVRKLAARWLPQVEIAEALKISTDTLQRWMKAHPELAAAYALGKEDATDRVERSLYDRANGYTHPSEKIVVVAGPRGEGSSVERVETVEHYPPDPAALKLWLTNRRGKEWSDKVDHQHAGNVRIVIDTGVPRPEPNAGG